MSAKFKRLQRGLRLWTLFLVLLLSSASMAKGPMARGQCPRCVSHSSLAGAVEVSLNSESFDGQDGVILTDVRVADALVDPPYVACPHCGETSLREEVAADPDDGPPFVHSEIVAYPQLNSPQLHSQFGKGDPWGSPCDMDPMAVSVRDELAERRGLASSWCPGLLPRFRFRAGAVYMDRLNEDFGVLMESSSSPIRQINAEGFDFDWEPGLDVSVSQLAWDDTEFEFRFLGLRQFSADQFVNTEGSEVRINSDPPVFAPGVQSINARYTSDLYGFELNWHYVTYCPFNYIAGFRYIALDEDLTAILDADPQTFLTRTSTRNDLYGLQVGITSVPDMPLFGWHCLSWFGKAGVFGNDAQQQTVLDTSPIGQVVTETPGTSTLVYEFGIGLDLPLRDCISIQGGYSALILQRVAVASDQLQEIDFLTATGSDNRGTVMYHGVNLSLVLCH